MDVLTQNTTGDFLDLTTSALRVPRELEVVLNGPVGPHRLANDTILIDTEGWYRFLTPSSACPDANEVVFSNLDPLEPDRHLLEVIGEYHRRGLPVVWCVYPWTRPFDL